MKKLSTAILLVASSVSAPMFAVSPEIGITHGSASLDIRGDNLDQVTHGTGVKALVGDKVAGMSFAAGLGLTRNVFNTEGLDAEYDDLSAVLVAGFDTGLVNPYFKLDYIAFSRGEFKDTEVDNELTNSGYELAAGVAMSVSDQISLSLETALSAKKEFEIDIDGLPKSTIDYVYGPMDAWTVGMQIKL